MFVANSLAFSVEQLLAFRSEKMVGCCSFLGCQFIFGEKGCLFLLTGPRRAGLGVFGLAMITRLMDHIN